MKTLILLILVYFTIPGNAWSQWVRTNTPYGGQVTSVNKSPSSDFYATTATEIYKSTTGGQDWENLELTATWPILLVDNAGNLLVTSDSLILRSADGGVTWSESLVTSGFFTSMTKSSTNVLFAAHMNWDGETFVYVSNDNGQSWIPKPTNIGNYSHLRITAGIAGELYAASDIGLFKSTDEGDSWTLKYPGSIRSVVVNASNRIFIGIHYRDTIFTSADGENWEVFFKAPHIYPIASDSEGIYAIADNAFYYIKNDPAGWSEIYGLPQNIESIFIDEDETVYAASDGIFRSVNNGVDWENISTGIQVSTFQYITSSEDGELYAISNAIYQSSDNADSFEMIAESNLYNRTIREVLIHSSGTMYAIGNCEGLEYENSALFRSNDNGETFETILYMNINHLRINQQGHLFVATEAGLLRSTDEGVSWVFLDDGPDCMTEFSSLEISESGDVFVIDCQQIVYQSTDNGDSFQQKGTTEGELKAINAQGQLFAVSSVSIYRSVDNGLTWQSVYQNNLPYNQVRDLVIDQTGNLYFTLSSLGVFRSTDNGTTWAPFNEGLDYLDIVSIHASDDGYLYVSPEGGGIWKRNLNETVQTNKPILTRIYPNPASYSITIESPVRTEPVYGIVNIYTIEGNLLRSFTLNSALQSYDIRDLKPGIYIVRSSGEEGGQKLIKH